MSTEPTHPLHKPTTTGTRAEMAEAKVRNLTKMLADQRNQFTRTDAERANVAQALLVADLHHLEHHAKEKQQDERAHELTVANRDLEQDVFRLTNELREISRVTVNPESIESARKLLRKVAAAASLAVTSQRLTTAPGIDINPEGPQG